MESAVPDAVLLATLRVPMRHQPGLVVVQAGGEAASMWRTRRQATVFADFGTLSDGMTGVRLARTIRAQCKTTRICLLSDSPRPDQVQWARSQGADEVVARSNEAIAESLAGRTSAPAMPWFSSQYPVVESLDAVCEAVAAALNEAGLGPAATLAVDDAVQSLSLQKRWGQLQPADLANAVSAEILDPAVRRRFLSKFGVPR